MPARVVIIGIDKISDEGFKSNAVIDWAIKNHVKSGDHVVFMHASKDLSAAAGGKVSADLSPDVIETMQRKLVADAHAKLDALSSTYGLKLDGIVFSCEIIKGSSGETIVDRADKLQAETVIVGSRGLGVVKRAMLGSVSQYLAANCPTNVIICKKF